MIISPDKSLILICLAISSAASKFVSKAVLSTFFCLIDFPELTSIETRASVGLITRYPPEFNLIVLSNISFNFSSIFSLKNNGVLSLYFFIFFKSFGIMTFMKSFAF